MKSYILVNSGRGYEKFDGVDNEIKLMKFKLTYIVIPIATILTVCKNRFNYLKEELNAK